MFILTLKLQETNRITPSLLIKESLKQKQKQQIAKAHKRTYTKPNFLFAGVARLYSWLY